MEDEDMEAGMQSVDTMSSTPTGVETPDVIDLRKQQRKESERPTDKQLYQVLEQKEEKIAPGTLYGSSHTYATLIQHSHLYNIFCNGFLFQPYGELILYQ